MTEPTRTRSTITWPVVAVATLLALLAAGAVLFVAGGDEAEVSADAGRDGTMELRPADEVPTGDPLDVEFTDLDDTTGTLREVHDGNPMVVNFFASWCSPCVKEMPDFETVSQDLGDEVDFFGLALQDRPEDAQRIVEQTGVTYDWSRDIQGDIAGAAGVVQMPTTMFVDADGEVVEVHAGALDADRLRSLVDEHLGVSAG